MPLDILALEHYERVTSEKGNYVSPCEKIKEELHELKLENKNRNSLLILFLEKVQEEQEFKKLIISPLSEFSEIIKSYKPFEQLFTCTISRKKILDLFGYKRLRKLNLMFEFARDLGIKTCPYCNSQFILTLTKSKKANLHFDHFYSQKDYPYLCLAYFNLIPCCAGCNTFKSDKFFDINNNIHPYLDSLHDKFVFRTNRKNLFQMILEGEQNPDKIDIQIIAKKGYEKIMKHHTRNFRLQEVYDNHKDIAMEVIAKAYSHPDKYIESLKEIYPLKKSEIDRFLLGNYTLTSEINKRPLSKFMQDLYSINKKRIK